MRPSSLMNKYLLSDAELSDDSSVTLDVLLLQVSEHVAALTNHLQQATTGMVVVLVLLQMLGELLDALGQDCVLYCRRSGVGLVGTVWGYTFCLLFFADHN